MLMLAFSNTVMSRTIESSSITFVGCRLQYSIYARRHVVIIRMYS